MSAVNSNLMAKKLRLRQSVGIVSTNNGVEFFKTNTRDSLKLEINFPNIVEVLSYFDGESSMGNVLSQFSELPAKQFTDLVELLIKHHVLIEQNIKYPNELANNHYRLINLIEDYKHSTMGVINAIDLLKKSNVMIIGLGAVGSFITVFLAKNGVKNFIIVDNDTVDESNLHRQFYFESDIEKSKIDSLTCELESINKDIIIQSINDVLDVDFFEKYEEEYNLDKVNLIINCSDFPNVDVTSKLVSSFSMKYHIPHIIGGGYNLHLTLIGQTIIPFKTACFKCFEDELRKINTKDLEGVRKLHLENRKLGAYPPLSGIASTLASLDAFKVLIEEEEYLQQANRRIDFNIHDNQFNILDIPKNKNCSWCGENPEGKYE